VPVVDSVCDPGLTVIDAVGEKGHTVGESVLSKTLHERDSGKTDANPKSRCTI
jgi:hypothetical protein